MRKMCRGAIKAAIEMPFIMAMNAKFVLTKNRSRRKALLILEQYPNYRTALYPVLDDYYRAKRYEYVLAELKKEGFHDSDFYSGNTFHSTDEAMEWIDRLLEVSFILWDDD